MSDRMSRSQYAVISTNAMATARNMLLYVLDVPRLVMSSVPVQLIPIARRPCLHAAAATISLEKTLIICFLYLLPNTPVSKLSLAELFEQLPMPFLVLGNFNAHSPAWGNSCHDGLGRCLEEFMA
ncbi:RNA-directed DNA polymerase from mobile element jockey [Plakobranchus ocellatus]|uniref:RNA-directed DNA polymerase from mobile element jockey n=1 Tax=Plakobranchus ocellatus TaxID=259542 RepID=A0AAV4A6S6_9GAST|nr:RNA-directed DNA polymerase from mobile element jockey [Plakobranchus ocellatus]